MVTVRATLLWLLCPILFSTINPPLAQTQIKRATKVRVKWEHQVSKSVASLRGLSAVDDSIVWASGTRGALLRTLDSGNTWQACYIPGADSLDFRDVEAFDQNLAYIMSAGSGEKSRIYKTTDGGQTWQLQFMNQTAEAFFDGMAFWDEENGIAYSDPVAAKHLLITTENGGQTWTRIPPENLPELQEGEYGFAASGTGIVTYGSSHVWIASGGMAARIFHSADRGQSWAVYSTPIVSGTQSSGIFSLAFRDMQHGIAVGGDYANPEQANGNVACTADGGKNWRLIAEPSQLGYRSCVAYVPGTSPPMVVAVGSEASSFSADEGLTWTTIDTVGYHVVNFGESKDSGWAAGAQGRIAKFKMHIGEE